MEFKKIFISHRSFDYDKALQLEKTLLNHNVCSEVVFLRMKPYVEISNN